MGNRIHELRLTRKMTQKELAEKVGCSAPYIFDLENGNRGARPDTWLKIAEALGVTVQELREEEECPPPCKT